ncbi:MAG: ABC transporter ATP-binding protein [Anaerolineae bacterium]
MAVVDVFKSFGPIAALQGVSFPVALGEVAALLGPSGCGKSTTLKVVAGLESPDTGTVLWDGAPVDAVPPHRRGFGLMFQDLALFPHLGVRDNVAFGLRMAGLDGTAAASRVTELLDLVGLPGMGDRDIGRLSGGERQRVALARALAPRPRLLMLDEPLGSLDRGLRERLMADLRSILAATNQTAIYVTHDQDEAFALADRVVVMNDGRVEASGSPEGLYRNPATVFVARFLGMHNIVPGTVVGPCPQEAARGAVIVDTPIGRLEIPGVASAAWGDSGAEGPARPGTDAAPPNLGAPGARATILIRPDGACLGDAGPLVLAGQVQGRSFRGAVTHLAVGVSGTPLRFVLASTEGMPEAGQRVRISIDPARSLQVLAG